MKKYETYKESNNKAIGIIPKNWNITSIKNILEIPITDGPHTTPEFYDEGIPFLSAEAVKGGKLDFNRKRGYISEEDYELYSQKYTPKKGDIYMIKSGATTGNTAMVETDRIFNIWSPLAVFRANKLKMMPKFLHYYLMSPNFKSLVELSWSYGTQQNIGMGVLSNLSIPYGTVSEQTQIAKYLDHKTQIIDALIEKKEQLIKKLQAQRQAIINEAVTKGLNKNVELKDSGIEWLGEIPEPWEVVKFRHKFKTTKGLTITKAHLLDKGVPCVNYGEIHSKFAFEVNPAIHNLKYVSENYLETNAGSLLKKGDFVFADTSEDIEGSGNFTYLNSDIPTFAGYHTIIARIIEPAHKRFFAYFFDSILYRKQVQNAVKGVKVYSITNKILKDTALFFPPIEEQIVITSFLDEQINSISNSANKLKESIKKLKSYRQSIISEAVTGKIDVSHWQVPKK